MLCYLTYLGSEPREDQPIAVSEIGPLESSLPPGVRPVQDISPPVFVKKIDDALVDAGEEARFDARIHAVPEPQVEWYKGSQKIVDEGRFVHIDALEKDLFTLIIEKVEPGDCGAYKCIASNEAGETTCEAQLAVKGEQEAPETADEPESSVLDVSEGGEVNLNVTFSGPTKPTVEWLKDGKPVRKTSRLNRKAEGDTYTLTIQEAVPDDSGRYTFKATSPAGTTSKSFDVNVQGTSNH